MGFKMQQVRFRLDSQANFLTVREALERLTHYLNFTGEPQEADCTVSQDASESEWQGGSSVYNGQGLGLADGCLTPPQPQLSGSFMKAK